jgi:hypothetical protein
LFHTGGAPGIHPSEVSSPARFRRPFGRERTHIPLAQRFFRRRSVRPARRASVSGFTPLGIALRSHGVLSRRPPAPPLGFAPLGFDNGDLAPDFSGAPLACLSRPRDCSRDDAAPQSIDRSSPCLARPSPEGATGRDNPYGVPAPAPSWTFVFAGARAIEFTARRVVHYCRLADGFWALAEHCRSRSGPDLGAAAF